MNRKEWDQTMPSILAGLAPGKYSLREIMLDSFSRYPQAHEGVFLYEDVAGGRYQSMSFSGGAVKIYAQNCLQAPAE